jgi:outer membrane protein
MLATALAVSAGPAPAETLADALVTAYQTSPLLESSRAALRSLDEGVPQARADRLPQVGAGVSADVESEFGNFTSQEVYSVQAALNASLLVFDSGQTAAAIESARNIIAAGRADLQNVEQLVLFNAVQAYADVRRDMEFVRLASNDVDRLLETLRATENRFEVGEVTRTDVSQSQSRLAASRSTLAAAEGQLELSREAYRAAVGVRPQNLEPLPPIPDLPDSVEAAVAVGLQRNPQIVAAQYNERAAVYDFDRAIAAGRPTVTVDAGLGWARGNQFNQALATDPITGLPTGGAILQEEWDGDGFASLAVTGEMPLYTGGRNSSLIRQAQAVLDQRRFEVQDTARTVTQDVAGAWTDLDVARASIVARREQVEAARIAAEGVAEEARLGARSTLDVLDADQERLTAEAEVVSAVRDEYVAAYSLLQAMGLLTVAHLGLGIETYEPDVNFVRVRNNPVGGYNTSVVDRIRARWEK